MDCDFVTFQKGNLAKHTKIIHRKDIDGQPVTENIRCNECSYSCFTEEQLKNHILRRHTIPELAPFKCELCSYKTPEKAALLKHTRICHSNIRPFPCEFCGMRYIIDLGSYLNFLVSSSFLSIVYLYRLPDFQIQARWQDITGHMKVPNHINAIYVQIVMQIGSVWMTIYWSTQILNHILVLLANIQLIGKTI